MIQPTDHLAARGQVESIELVYPARADLVVLARFTAATIAARAGFDIEEIEDLRLAVDEGCVSFGPMNREAFFRMELSRTADTVRIVASFEPVSDASGTDRETLTELSWERGIELSERLVDSLVDEHGRDMRNGRAVAWLPKRRAMAQ
jgi:hypothetical protein